MRRHLPVNADEARVCELVAERKASHADIDAALLRYRAAAVAQPRQRDRLLTQVSDSIVGPPAVLKGRALAMARALYG